MMRIVSSDCSMKTTSRTRPFLGLTDENRALRVHCIFKHRGERICEHRNDLRE